MKDRISDNSGCFITSILLECMGRDDNCEELNAFRSFRNNWLRHETDGPILIKEYYKIAPVVVREIEKREDKE